MHLVGPTLLIACAFVGAAVAGCGESSGTGSDPIVGCYAWFNGGTVQVFANGTMVHTDPSDSGTWTDDGRTQYTFRWKSGFADVLAYTAGSGLSGTNGQGVTVGGSSIHCPSTTGSPNASSASPSSCVTSEPIRNAAAIAPPGSQEIPGEQHASQCPGPHASGPNCGVAGSAPYCAGANQCCAAQGHPELSCPPGAYCTTDGHCTSSAACGSAPSGLFSSCTTNAQCATANAVLLCSGGKCTVREGGPCTQDSWCGPGQSCHGGACAAAVAGGSSGTSGGSSGTSGGSCSEKCSSLCTGNVPEQACFYCEASCVCACSGDSACAAQNRQSAKDLGTVCPQ